MQPPSITGQPALSILVILPPSAHMIQNNHNPSPLVPSGGHAPPPLIGRKSGSTVPVLKALAESSTSTSTTTSTTKTASPTSDAPTSESRLRYQSSHISGGVNRQDSNESHGRVSPDPESEEEAAEADVGAGVDPIRIAGRRASLTPGLGGGTETRSPEPRSILKLGTIEPSPPGTPRSRSVSPCPGDAVATTHSNSDSFDAYRVVNGPPASSASASASASTSTSRASPITGSSVEAPAFGSRNSIAGARRSRRPVTTATSVMQPHRGGSMALPSGSGYGLGGGGSYTKTRPGWEADEIVSVLRSGGLEVTLVRNASHLPPLLSSPDESSSFLSKSISVRPTSSTATATAVIPVILVPLCDSPSLPSLSLLLAQGTTPTAVCFQQDLLERAKQTEEEWLPSALAQIRTVVEMRNQASVTRQQQSPTSSVYEQPIILAYSANPGLSPQTTQQCIKAGASGIVKPPFHSDTARMVKRMVRAARDGRISSVVDLPSTSHGANGGPHGRQWEQNPSSRSTLPSRGIGARGAEEDNRGAGKVILPPTALDMGGEHEGEKVLEAAMTHRRQQSLSRNRQQSQSQQSLTPPTHLVVPSSNGLLPNGQPTTPMTPGLPIPFQNRDIRTPITARTDHGQSPSGLRPEMPTASKHDTLHPYLATLSRYCPSYIPRRRSVDVGCLSIALDRATSAFESNPPVSTTVSSTGASTTKQTKQTKQKATPMTRSKTSNQASGSTSTLKSKNGTGKKRRQTDIHPAQPAGGDDGAGHEGAETHLAELLSAMYCHTTMVTDVQMGDYAAVSAPLSPEHRRRLVESLATWNFKPHRLDNGDLYRVATLLFEGVLASEGIVELGIQRDQMNRFLFAIRAIYHAPNPYHNYVHAIDVLQATYSFLLDLGLVPPYSYLLDLGRDQAGPGPWTRSDEETNLALGVGSQRAREVMRPQDVLAVLIAAMGHDVGHPGLSNAFMKNAKVPLSEVYDDKSVLENMHCMLVVRLLRKYGFGSLVSSLPIPASSSNSDPSSPWAVGPAAGFDTHGFRKVLYSSVLATDMSLHFAWIARLKSFGAGLHTDSRSASKSESREGSKGKGKEEEDRIMISQAIIKCADISNPTRPIDISEHWSSVLLEEWAKQASLEQELDLPVSVIASADAALQAKGQIGFIDLFTQPLFEAVSDILPEFQGYANLCAENRSIWQTRLDSFTSDPDQQSSMVQPPIEAASTDDRFRSLFPLLLPPSLLELELETETGTISSVQSPLTPPQPTLSSDTTETLHFPIYNQQDDSSSGTKAMRAVYYTDLLEHKARGVMNNGSGVVPIPGVGGFEWDFDRRMSTPSGILEGKQ